MSTTLNNLSVTRTSDSKLNQVDWENLPFGRVFSDHMLVMDYKDGAWQAPAILPFQNLQLHPATSAIHYGQSIFEGLKAYKNQNDEVVIFRPQSNAKRFRESCLRMCMPELPEELFLDCVAALVGVDSNWIPSQPGYSLYIRPFLFATDDFIGIKPSESYKFMIFTCPVGAYYSQPLRVKIEERYTRAAEGGVGRAKTAGNYAASLYPAKLGNKEGYHQLVWTDAKEHKYVEESGTMNIVFVKNGKIITPSEESDTILPGITKRSVLELAAHFGIPFEERKIEVTEIIDGIKDGSITDAFGAGTAATIAPIQTIGFRGQDYELPSLETREISSKIHATLDGIKAGTHSDVFNWIYKVI
ncbi:MAG: branched-chain amino acid aminotransferase [Crocinitomicaceae bacterium]|nr:branched-chain amino acid aminotransferase [Crocinitomicaceae bacterium]